MRILSFKSSMVGLVLTYFMAQVLPAQQIGDVNFNPSIDNPAYPQGEGPVVLIDEAHHNFHTVNGRYQAFADLLRRDGYVVKGLASKFTLDALQTGDILVISNALAEANVEDWSLPTSSAFNEAEITAVQRWLNGGGSLLLIADHMPFPGAAAQLAEKFGLLFSNGYVLHVDSNSGPMKFRLKDGSLQDHPITRGRNPTEAVKFVTTFTGQAFRIEPGVSAQSLMILDTKSVLMFPLEAGGVSEKTPRLSAAGMLQGAALRLGAGSVAVFGEAAMFTAQVSGPERRPMGMNHPEAPYNAQFVLNVLHWLSGLLPDR